MEKSQMLKLKVMYSENDLVFLGFLVKKYYGKIALIKLLNGIICSYVNIYFNSVNILSVILISSCNYVSSLSFSLSCLLFCNK